MKIKKILAKIREIKNKGETCVIQSDGQMDKEKFNLWFDSWIKEPLEQIERMMETKK